MAKPVRKSLRQTLSIIIVVIIIAGMIPLKSLLDEAAAIEAEFTVRVPGTLKGDIAVALTNEAEPDESLEINAVGGIAVFTAFYDPDKTYTLTISGVFGYEIIIETGITGELSEKEYTAEDFVAYESAKVIASGTVFQNDGTTPYKGGGSVEYADCNGYTTQSVDISTIDGSFEAMIYVNQEYFFDINISESKYVTPDRIGPIKTATATSLGSIILEEKILSLYTVEFTINPDGTITDSNGITISEGESFETAVSGGIITAWGGDNPGFTATATSLYHILSIEIDGEEKLELSEERNEPKAFSSAPDSFEDTGMGHTVKVIFGINQNCIEIITNGDCGEITVEGVLAGESVPVNHGDGLELRIEPSAGYVIGDIIIDGEEIHDDNEQLYDNDDYSVTYIFDCVDNDQILEVTFVPEARSTKEEGDIFILGMDKIAREYEDDGKRVLVFDSTAIVTFNATMPYNKISLNNDRKFKSLVQLESSGIITSVSVKKEKGVHSIETKFLEKPILIVIDKEKPVVTSPEKQPDTEWTNRAVTITGKAYDEGGSEIHNNKVRYSLDPNAYEADSYSGTPTSLELNNGNYSLIVQNDVSSSETYYFWAYDWSGNKSEPVQSIGVNIDIVPPEITGFHFQKIESSENPRDFNALTYGTFYNEDIEVIVSAQDTGDISSGLKEITLYKDGFAFETKEVIESSATFRLPLTNFYYNEISASATDKAGNESAGGPKKPTDKNVTANVSSSIISLSTEKPAISIIPTKEPLYTNGDKKWYNGNVAFIVTAGTRSGSIYSIETKINGKIITNDKNGKAVDTNFFDFQTLQELFTVNTDQNFVDGENTIEVTATNIYGNEVTVMHKVYIDITNPKIVGFNIETEEGFPLSSIHNFLSFGNFYNKKVKITIVADDRYGATSGVNTITLFANGRQVYGSPKRVTAVGDGTYKAEFIMPDAIYPEAMLLDVVLSALATDNVGNITGKDEAHPDGVPVTPSSVNPNLRNNRVMVETITPVINISSPNAAYIDNSQRRWYAEDVLFTVAAGDTDAGIRSVRVRINGESILTDADGKVINTNFYGKQTGEEFFRISTSQGTRAQDGSYLIEVNVTDNAGNLYYANDTVYKDADIPVITRYRFVPATIDGISETSSFIGFLEYDFYFKTEFTAIVEVSDQEPSSGLAKVEYRLISYQNGKKTGETKGTQNITEGMAAISIPKGFKGQIVVNASDFTGNTSSEVTTGAVVIDDTPPEIAITNNNTTSYNDANGNKLYVSDMSFTVAITDYSSGIKRFGYSQSAEKGSFERKSISFENTGYKVGDILEDGWAIAEMDANVVTKVTRTFSYSSDDNDVFLTFDASDRSGNNRENVQSEKITIDKVLPIIDIVFREAEYKNSFYYNENRIADITVTERNFDPGLILVSIENSFGSVPGFSFSSISNTEHIAVIEFDEGDYTFDITGTDLGDHYATVNFSGENERFFYIDKTAPVMEENFASFSKNETEDSFNTDKIVEIKITEHNFDPYLVNLRVNGKEPGEDHTADDLFDMTYEAHGAGDWVSSGDIHTLTFKISREAVYQIEIEPSDLAGNSSDFRNTVVFEIDKTAPVAFAKNSSSVSGKDNALEFLDIYPYSRKDAPAPTVEFFDLNIDYIKYELTVYIPDYTRPEALTVIRPVTAYLDTDANKSGKITGNMVKLPDFTKDGIYALKLSAFDIAGNESLLNSNTYAKMVEHDVLAYILESNLEKKTGIYSFQYENGDAISKRPEDFSDISILVLAKKDSDIDIVLRDNNADEINTNTQASTEDNMYGIGVNNFILKSEFFKEKFQDDTDAELRLAVKNDGNRVDLGKIHIDNVAPVCIVTEEFRSWHWYYSNDDRTIVVSSINELIDETQCKVYDNGMEVKFDYSDADDTVVFTLAEGWHNVGIILSDMAGNANNIQEKVSIHVGFFWLWIILSASAIIISTAVFAIVYSVRKRRKLENAL